MPRLRSFALYVAIAFVALLHASGIVTSLSVFAHTPDFGAYYAAAWAARNHLPLYDWPAVVERAHAAGIPAADVGLPFRYPPMFALLLVPITFLSYTAARIAWLAGLLAAAVWTGLLLAKYVRRPWWLLVPMALAFAPVYLSIAWGNIASLLSLGVAALMLDLSCGRSGTAGALGFVAACWPKVFPLVWPSVLIPARKRSAAIATGASVLALAVACAALYPRQSVDFLRQLGGDTLSISDPGRLLLPVPNLQSLLIQLTRPWSLEYRRHGLSFARSVAPVFPLAVETVRMLGRTLALFGGLAAITSAWRIAARGRPVEALGAAVAGTLLFEPVGFYTYISAALPGLVRLAFSDNTRLRGMALVIFGLLGIGRFSLFLTVYFPGTWLLGHAATAALLILWLVHIAEGERPAQAALRGSPSESGRALVSA